MMDQSRVCLMVFMIWSLLTGTLVSARDADPLTISAQAEPFSIQPQQIFNIRLKLHLPPQYRAYSDQFKLQVQSPDGFLVSSFKLQPEIDFFDPNFKKNKVGITDGAVLTAPIQAPGFPTEQSNLILNLTYQACTDTYCLFPITKAVTVDFSWNSPRSKDKSLSFSNLGDHFKTALHKSLLWAFFIVFVAGVLTSFTPCIFPIIPITLAVLTRHAHLRTKRKQLLVSHIYVFGMATTYSLLGILAAATGQMFGSFINHPITLTMVCGVFLATALSMFGVFEIQAPYWIRRRFSGEQNVHGFWGVFTYGMIAGIVASPCVGPVLVAVLTYVAQTQNLWLGFALLFVFALGLGQLFLILGLSSKMTQVLPKSGPWMESVKYLSGFLMLGAFYYYLSLLLSDKYFYLALGIGLILLGSFFGALKTQQKISPTQKIIQGIFWAILFIGSFITYSALFREETLGIKKSAKSDASLYSQNFPKYTDEKLLEAKVAKKPVIIDFWAEWCAACLELDQKTFSDPQFQRAAKDFVILKFDATKGSDQLDVLKNKYNIVGLPHIVFLNSEGEWLSELTVNEFLPPDKFIERMEKAQR